MQNLRSLLWLCCLLPLTACQNRPFDPGVYDGNAILFTADKTIGEAFDTLHHFVAWEQVNREALRPWPGIKNTADTVRRNVSGWRAAILSARDAYAGDPSEANRSKLQKAIAVVRSALASAIDYQKKHEKL